MDNKNLGVDIISIQASTIMRAIKSPKKQITIRDYMWKGSLPYSLDLIKLRELAPKTFFKEKSDIVEKNMAIINVEFDSALYSYIHEINYRGKQTEHFGYQVIKEDSKRDKIIMDIKALRKELYDHGFYIGNRHYLEFKRSGSKAKEGDHLFILEEYLQPMRDYCRLGIEIPQNIECDLTSIKAYESLTGSSIEYTLKLKPDEILIVRDLKHKFSTNVNQILMGKNKIPYNKPTENYKMENDCFDGESLLDSSCFSKDEHGNMASMQLLRNAFLKTASFNCEIQAFFKANGITEVWNAYGRKQVASKIKLIITPNSLKIYKLKNFIETENEHITTDKDAYYYWIKQIKKHTTFGVVKTEHISNFGNGRYNKLSYQMINSLPLSRKGIESLLQIDFDYIISMKKYPAVLREHIKNTNLLVTGDMINNLIYLSDEFANTDLYKNYLHDAYSTYKENIYKGKVSVKGDYGVICSMVYELLLSTQYQKSEKLFKEFKRNLKPLQAKGEVYKADLKENETVAIFRSPHICASNVIVGTNKSHEEFTQWFHFNKGILVVTPWEWDIMERGNSLDFDSDAALVVREDVIVQSALEVQNFATPVHDIPNDPKLRYNTPESLADLDNIIAINKIGEIVNLSQDLNSYYWNEYYKGDNADKKLLKTIYDQILVLAILSNIEIDKSKHVFDLSMGKILNKIRNIKYKNKKIIESDDVIIQKIYTDEENSRIDYLTNYTNYLKVFKDDIFYDETSNNKELKQDEFNQEYNKELVTNEKELKNLLSKKQVDKKGNPIQRPKKPFFLKYHSDGIYAWDLDIKCPMNYVVEILKANKLTVRSGGRVSFEEYLKTKDIDINDGLRKQRTFIFDTAAYMRAQEKSMKKDKYRDKTKDNMYLKRYEDFAIAEVMRKKLSVETIMSTINHLYKKNIKKEIKQSRLKILGLLWKSQKGKRLEDNLFLKCLKLCTDTRTELIQDDNGDIVLWGIKYLQNK